MRADYYQRKVAESKVAEAMNEEAGQGGEFIALKPTKGGFILIFRKICSS